MRAHSAPMPVGPRILCEEKATKSASHSWTSVATCGTNWHASTSTSAPCAWAASASGRMSLIVPNTFDIALMASRRAPSSSASRSERSRRKSAVMRDPAELDAPFGGEDLPRHHVGVMLHVRQHDRVAGAEVRAGPRVGDEVDRLGRVAGEDDLVGARCVDEARDLAPGVLERGRRFFGDRVHAAVDVGVVVPVRSRPSRRAPRRAFAPTTRSRGRRAACR